MEKIKYEGISIPYDSNVCGEGKFAVLFDAKKALIEYAALTLFGALHYDDIGLFVLKLYE